MEIDKNNIIKFVIFFLIIIVSESCTTVCTNRELIGQQLNMEFKNGLLEYYTLNPEEMLSHFPRLECGKKNFWSVRYLISSHIPNDDGAYYSEKKTLAEIDSILSNYSFKAVIDYYATNTFKIRHFLINDTTLYERFYKYDSIVLKNYPIPTFYDVGFGLGESLDYIDSTQDWLSIPDSIRMPIFQAKKSNVPDDLTVYIIDAKKGYFRKNKNKPSRPFMGEWTNGYSRGIAVSKKEKIICYWFMIW